MLNLKNLIWIVSIANMKLELWDPKKLTLPKETWLGNREPPPPNLSFHMENDLDKMVIRGSGLDATGRYENYFSKFNFASDNTRTSINIRNKLSRTGTEHESEIENVISESEAKIINEHLEP